MRIFHLFLFVLLGLGGIGLAAQPSKELTQSNLEETRLTEASFVVVVLSRVGGREYRIPWEHGMTVESAIARAAGSRALTWDDAWRWRANFWTRNFRDPHSFWARILAGDRASGYERFSEAEGGTRKARVRPGDRIFVDLEPIV